MSQNTEYLWEISTTQQTTILPPCWLVSGCPSSLALVRHAIQDGRKWCRIMGSDGSLDLSRSYKKLYNCSGQTLSSMVGMMWCSLMKGLFNERLSTQVLMLFSLLSLGTTTIGDTQGVRPVHSMMSSFLSYLSFSSTCFFTWNETRQCGCASRLIESSTCVRAGSPLYLPIPLVWQGNSSRKSGA